MNNKKSARGMIKAGDHANKVIPGWIDAAAEYLLRASTVVESSEFTIEHLRLAGGGFEDPPDLRAWGLATQQAVKYGYIERSGNYAKATSSNNSPKPLYLSKYTKVMQKNPSIPMTLDIFMV